MQLVIRKQGNSAVIKVWSARLDRDNVGAFLHQVGPILAGCARVIIDLQRVMDIDPHGVGSLLTCRYRLKQRGGRLTLQQGDKGGNLFPELFRRARIFPDASVPVSILQAF